MKTLTEYVLGLPSFTSLSSELHGSLKLAQDGILDEFEAIRKKLLEEMALLKTKMNDKLDEKAFNSFKLQMEQALRKYNSLGDLLDKLARELATKADDVACKRAFEELHSLKADRSELLSLLQRADLEPLQRDIAALSEALDSVCAKTNLQLHELRSNATTPAGPPAERRHSGAFVETDHATISRLASLEEVTKQLGERKADKKEVSDVIIYVDNALAGIGSQIDRMPAHTKASTTPGITPSDEPRNLPPRPASAERRPSIPEVVRPPSPKIQYTSSPIKYVPNLAKYRATATLFDTDGNPTPASVTMPMKSAHVTQREHWENMAAHVAGIDVIPADHTLHEMP